jgi:hypothetical protein
VPQNRRLRAVATGKEMLEAVREVLRREPKLRERSCSTPTFVPRLLKSGQRSIVG